MAHRIGPWVNRVLVTVFCACAAWLMALLGMVTMDPAETAQISPVCFFVAAALLVAAIMDAMENPVIRRKR